MEEAKQGQMWSFPGHLLQQTRKGRLGPKSNAVQGLL